MGCRGRIRLAGRDVTGAAAHERARLGLVRNWQAVELFEDLTVRENLSVAADRQGIGDFFTDLVRPTAGATDRALLASSYLGSAG